MMLRSTALLDARLETRDGFSLTIRDLVFSDGTWLVAGLLVELADGSDRQVKAIGHRHPGSAPDF
jgi:hypothetical protein